jgi:pyruvate,water dikinase
LVEKGVIETPEDLYYLYFDQVRSAVESDDMATGHMDDVRRRKREMEKCEAITPPATIYGENAPPVETAASSKLSGTPTSRGTHRGPARVVQGIRDFDKVQEGDVLVIPYSDVGWTPLFARAGAVIAESGGILSHSSIVAREYGIPAVVSVPGACQLVDDTLVTVDGYRGEILIHQTLDAE